MSSESTLTLGTYASNDADHNGCHGQAIKALRYLAEHPPAAGGSQSFNVEHLLQIANELELSFKVIQKAAQTTPGTSDTHISIQEAWMAAGGNPGIVANRQELIEVLKAMDEAEEEADMVRERLETIESLWPDTVAAFRGAFDTPLARRRDNSEYAEDARARIRAFSEAMTPEPELLPEEAARLEAEANTAQNALEQALRSITTTKRSPARPL